MERFDPIYPFTTENIAGYMQELDLTGKRIVTVTGSSDHILNAISRGATDIRTFDINPKNKYYMDLKLASLEYFSYEDFLHVLLYDNDNVDCNFISKLNMPHDSKDFFIKQLLNFDNNWLLFKQSKVFNRKHFNPDSKLWENLYLDQDVYEEVQKRIHLANISFAPIDLKDLVLEEDADYMFLSNIPDYLKYMYEGNFLENYKELLYTFLNKVKVIYFAYLYDIGNNHPRTDIDNLEKVEKVFENFDKVLFQSALENVSDKQDGVLILRRN